MSSFRRHIPYLPFHKQVIREICRPQKDDLLIMAKGLGMRRIICALLKTYDRKEDLVLVVNATPSDDAGIGDELGIMGVRDPGFRVLTYEMSIAQREEMYRHGGLFSVTSKILVNDFLKGTVPAKLITGLVILHAEKVAHGSQEEFAVRLYRRENQSGFCKAFSDEPETFAHGMSPLRDMIVNLNMTNVMILPRLIDIDFSYNETVKVSLATRQAEVVEMYQPMTDLMRQCQDAITECMEAMLVELKRDHSLNLDLEDINVRNAQFKNFDTIVRMRLKPVWHKVGAKTKIHVSALTELRNLHTWLLEYDSATFASYINTLQRQHFRAQKLTTGPGRHIHDWFNARAASMLVEASQARISRKRIVMDNEPDPERDYPDEGHWGPERGGLHGTAREHEDDLEALREMETRGRGTDREEEEDLDVMETFATQTQVVPQPRPRDAGAQEMEGDEEDEEMREVGEDEAVQSAAVVPPPVFRPLHFDIEENLTRSVERRMRKGHEPVLEEQPKWSLLAKVLKEIEDTIARVSESHADAPGTNIVLIMASSDRSCLQLRQYLTTMIPTDPLFGAGAGRKMMETLFLSNWQHEKNGEQLSNPARMDRFQGGDEVRVQTGEMEERRMDERAARKGQPRYKRRRIRGGAAGMVGRRTEVEMDMMQKEAMMAAQSAFAGGEDPQMQWALAESSRLNGGRPANFNGIETDLSMMEPTPNIPPSSTSSSTATSATPAQSISSTAGPSTILATTSSSIVPDAPTLLATQGVVEEEDLAPDPNLQNWLADRGLLPEDFESEYGLLAPEDTVIIRPYGGEDDDILLQELRPRFVIMYEPNLAFIRRLEVYKNCNPGLALRVYQMTYTNSFEEDRFLSTMSREAEAFKKLIDDRAGMVIPIYNNNPRAPMRDNITRSKTTYSSRNAGGGEPTEEARIIVDIREMGALLPSLMDAAGIKVVPATLTVGDYVLSPKMVVERKALPDLEASFANGRLHTQCEAMTSHYEICILLIEFEEDKFGLRTKEDSRRETAGRNKPEDDWDAFYLQSKLSLLALHFQRLRIIWSSSPHESVKILSDLKLNFDEPDETTAILKGSSDAAAGAELLPGVENAGAVEMLRAIPGVSGHSLKYVMGKVESIREMAEMSQQQLQGVLGEEQGRKAWEFIQHDERVVREQARRQLERWKQFHATR